MPISEKSVKILWSNAAGKCSHPGCWVSLCLKEADAMAHCTIGEMAHICGDRPGALRHDPKMSAAERDEYPNRILLCPNHHTLIDKPENESVYTVEFLNRMKSDHEAKVLERLDTPDMPTASNIASDIFILLADNRQSWLQYGPVSDLARQHPHNKTFFALWETERLSTIVPNNRKISAILNEYREVFLLEDQELIAVFLLHARSYEQWVADEIPYAAVKRFPIEFAQMIKERCNAGI